MAGGSGVLIAVHTALSLMALTAGIPAVLRLFGAALPRRLTIAFLALAALSTATGFLLPFTRITPAVATGMASTAALALLFAALRFGRLEGVWRRVYPACVVASLFFQVFVAIAQTFSKNFVMRALAPNVSQGLFAISELAAVAVFVLIGIAAVRAFRPEYA